MRLGARHPRQNQIGVPELNYANSTNTVEVEVRERERERELQMTLKADPYYNAAGERMLGLATN